MIFNLRKEDEAATGAADTTATAEAPTADSAAK